MHVLRMEPQQMYVVDANLGASREEEARKQFSAQENALLTLHPEWQAGDRPFFKREEGTTFPCYLLTWTSSFARDDGAQQERRNGFSAIATMLPLFPPFADV